MQSQHKKRKITAVFLSCSFLELQSRCTVASLNHHAFEKYFACVVSTHIATLLAPSHIKIQKLYFLIQHNVFRILQLVLTICFPAGKILDDFCKFRLGPRTSRKDKENARQTASHAHRFCQYMACGLPSIATSKDLRFLTQMDKLRL